MIIDNNISLKPYNTFNVDAKAKYFAEVNSIYELKQLLNDKNHNSEKILILGSGSNILFTKDFDGIVIKLNSTEIKLISETDDNIFIEADSGLEWDGFVKYTISNGISGIENLSLIPGKVGAAPIQNIGAYGVEVKDVIESVNIILLNNLDEKTLSNEECKFGYRDSIFKNELVNNFVVTSVLFKFSKSNKVNLSYLPLKNSFVGKTESEITSEDVRNAVIAIRESKLPDPNKLGNAGSFFKNPIITQEKYDTLKNEYSDLNGYPESNSKMKISAGWLIEKCGFMGKRIGDVGVHEKQALVIVNYGNATGNKIVEFSKMIQNEVKSKFNIKIINEVNIL
ncbi:MAG: UDP-N-acetylmuramate dehydrogenase [Melioribacteraceae bacterium]|jgi:UDP-N-acetylmuramate dehydrogenase|nr:UDP-N-acetylmuramate dehydrogenase [Melioribacteraceae bacterium]